MRTPVLLTWLLLAASTTHGAAPASPSTSLASPSRDIRPICGVAGYTLQTGYRFGANAELLPGETPIRSTADMVKLGWKHDEPWGRINNQLQYYVDDKLGITRAFKWTGPAWPNILVGNACGGSAGTGAILPETFTGSNSTMRIKWIRVFKPTGQEGSMQQK